MTERDLRPALRDARVISNAWARRLPRLRDEFVSACNLAIAEGLHVPAPHDFYIVCRCIMHWRCKDVYRRNVRDRGRDRPLWIGWEPDWKDDDYTAEWALDPWEPDDTGYLLGLVVGWLDDVERLGLASPRATNAVRLWLELGSMEAVAHEYGVTPSRICQLRREATDAIRGLAA